MEPIIIEKLVQDFFLACVQQDNFASQGNSKQANNQAQKINILFDQIKGTGVDGREKLLELVDDSNLVVAKMAAVYSLHYNSERCVPVLERLSQEPGLLGFGAKQTLRNWKSGKWYIDKDGIIAPSPTNGIPDNTPQNIHPASDAKAIDILKEIAEGQEPTSGLARAMILRSNELNAKISKE